MHEIKVVTISAEEAEHGVVELWASRSPTRSSTTAS
jgi:hypothetical protein